MIQAERPSTLQWAQCRRCRRCRKLPFILQSFEFGRTLADWLDRTNPRWSFDVARSLVVAATAVQNLDLGAARAVRAQATARLESLLGSTRLLAWPGCRRQTCPGPKPQTADGTPIGLSLMGPRGSDLGRLAFAAAR